MQGFEEQLSESDRGVVVDVSSPPAPTVVAFGGLAGGVGVPPYEFFRLLEGLPTNRVFVRDLEQVFYQRGVPGLGRTFDEMARNLAALLPRESERTVFVGTSAGAFAALIFGTLIGVDRIVTIAPVTFIDRWRRAAVRDRRWRELVDPVNRGPRTQRSYLDVKLTLRARRSGPPIDIYYPRHNRLDTIHARRLKRLPQVTLESIDSERHDVVREMRDSGALRDLIVRALGL